MNKFKDGDLVFLRKDITISDVLQQDFRQAVLQLASDIYSIAKRQNLVVTSAGPVYSLVKLEKKPRIYQIPNPFLEAIPEKEFTMHELALMLGYPVKVVEKHAEDETGR